MKNITLITLFVGALAFITSAYASVSGNLGVTTDYIWRGASQSDGVSVSGGLDYAGEGYYAGAWMGSVVDGTETNLFVGTDVNGFDVGVIQYSYSDGAGTDATEAYVGYSVAGFDLTYAQDLDNSDSDFYSASYALPTVIEGVSSSLTYGDTGASDYLQLDVSYGDLTITFVDNDGDETLTAVSYGWAL